jgi:hypothetical protein
MVMLFSQYDLFDIPIYDDTEEVYNIGDKLNMASYWSTSWPPTKISNFIFATVTYSMQYNLAGQEVIRSDVSNDFYQLF